MRIDPDAVKEFFDPHPGFAGAGIPIPNAVKEVADDMSGKRMSLREAVAKLQAVTSGEVSLKDGWIALWLDRPKCSGPGHMFKVICFK